MGGIEVERLWQDLLFSARTFRKNLNFSAAVVFSLALGIGGTCALFSVVYGVLIDPYIYRDAGRIVVPTFSEPDLDGRRPPLYYTVADFPDIEKSLNRFESVVLTTSHIAVTSGVTPGNANVLGVSPNYFDFFGTPALLGRVFRREDIPQAQNPPPFAVIGYQFWTKEFNRDPAVIGHDVRLGSDVYKVIGVMPPRFTWFDTDVFTPEPMRPRAGVYASVYLRVRKGVRLSSADSELQSVTERVIRHDPDRPGRGIRTSDAPAVRSNARRAIRQDGRS